MNASRIEQLKKFLKNDPQDPFPLYALALEYQKFDKKEAKKYFKNLLESHPEYTPAYYHAAHLWIELNEISQAKGCFEKGIEVAERNQDSLALRELKNAYQNFLFEWEDETDW
ncbi:MAG: tetratricopeptide repeat protein [Cytophagales bacterium]|nr:tetratricopeptide repeat protein [Cytophagales bacterium]